MKRLITLFTIALAFGYSFGAIAQMSKEDEKAWKKRLKDTTPVQYKNLLDENKSMKSQVASLRAELDNVDDQLAAKDEQINQYAAQAADLRDQLEKAKTRASSTPAGGIDENVGIVFKVQIGAYKGVKLNDTNSSSFGKEVKGDLNKYTIGVFKDYWEADTFKKYMREMGVKDAWIVAFKDGQRVDIKTVLEGKS